MSVRTGTTGNDPTRLGPIRSRVNLISTRFLIALRSTSLLEYLTESIPRMPLPSGGSKDATEFLCEFKKRARHGGKILPKTTWYTHNPGGRRGDNRNSSKTRSTFYFVPTDVPTAQKTQEAFRRYQAREPAAYIQRDRRVERVRDQIISSLYAPRLGDNYDA